MTLAAVFASRPVTPTRLREVRREAASILSMLTGESRALFVAAWMSEVVSRRTDAVEVPAPRVDPAFRLAQYRAEQASRAASAARQDPSVDACDLRRLEERAAEAWDYLNRWCQCDDMCECDHP
jgi:hypothetical protein